MKLFIILLQSSFIIIIIIINACNNMVYIFTKKQHGAHKYVARNLQPNFSIRINNANWRQKEYKRVFEHLQNLKFLTPTLVVVALNLGYKHIPTYKLWSKLIKVGRI